MNDERIYTKRNNHAVKNMYFQLWIFSIAQYMWRVWTYQRYEC